MFGLMENLSQVGGQIAGKNPIASGVLNGMGIALGYTSTSLAVYGSTTGNSSTYLFDAGARLFGFGNNGTDNTPDVWPGLPGWINKMSDMARLQAEQARAGQQDWLNKTTPENVEKSLLEQVGKDGSQAEIMNRGKDKVHKFINLNDKYLINFNNFRIILKIELI